MQVDLLGEIVRTAPGVVTTDAQGTVVASTPGHRYVERKPVPLLTYALLAVGAYFALKG